jgi:hypothetical protein
MLIKGNRRSLVKLSTSLTVGADLTRKSFSKLIESYKEDRSVRVAPYAFQKKA